MIKYLHNSNPLPTCYTFIFLGQWHNELSYDIHSLKILVLILIYHLTGSYF